MTEKMPMRVNALLLFMLTTVAVPMAGAAEWRAVAARGVERVDIDAARIMRTAEGVTVAWSRLALGRELSDDGGSYTAIHAMNRYDCAGGRFATLKRIYFNGDKPVREESIRQPREIRAAGGVEARLLAEACKPPEISQARQVAQAGQAAAPAAPAAPARNGRRPPPTPGSRSGRRASGRASSACPRSSILPSIARRPRRRRKLRRSRPPRRRPNRRPPLCPPLLPPAVTNASG